jgi:transcriptional regulator with XRE-family HTH domain
MLGNKKTPTPSQSFGITLRECRKKAGLTQEELALEAGIERNYVSLIELGRNQPTITMIFKLAKALNIKPSKLMTLTESKIKLL